MKLIQTQNVHKKDLVDLFATSIVSNFVKVSEDVYLALTNVNLKYKSIKQLRLKLDINKLVNNRKVIKSNVAIASAVTSYARIKMLEIKMYCLLINIKIFYTDTDSVFTDKPLPHSMVGQDLGLLKDELSGKTIQRAIFLGNKNYCYQYLDNNNILQTVSVFAGVKRNNLTGDHYECRANLQTIIVQADNNFSRDWSKMQIKIEKRVLNIKKSFSKSLKDNKYIPPVVNNPLLNYIKGPHKIINYLKKLI